MLGIGIVTYDRLPRLKECVAAIQKFTTAPFALVVADDGSLDGTCEWVREQSIPLVAGLNRGVGWNMNRAMFWLYMQGCDPICTIEDDSFPFVPHWETPWFDAAKRWNHVAWTFQNPCDMPPDSGIGTPDNPYRLHGFGAQCKFTSALALSECGYTDPRFVGRSFADAEWSWRMSHRFYPHLWSRKTPRARVCCLQTGINTHWDQDHPVDNTMLKESESLAYRMISDLIIGKEPVLRFPWRNAADAADFLEEQRTCNSLQQSNH